MSGGKEVAVAKCPIVWGDVDFGVYVGNSRVFGLWGDAFDGPWFIYPFADGERFLCIDDDDTSVLVFVVDCRAGATNAEGRAGWPPDGYARDNMARRAPQVVTNPHGVVRLPTLDEVMEASDYVSKLTPAELKRVSFPTLDLGVYRFYVHKSVLLKELDPNRTSLWP